MFAFQHDNRVAARSVIKRGMIVSSREDMEQLEAPACLARHEQGSECDRSSTRQFWPGWMSPEPLDQDRQKLMRTPFQSEPEQQPKKWFPEQKSEPCSCFLIPGNARAS